MPRLLPLWVTALAVLLVPATASAARKPAYVECGPAGQASIVSTTGQSCEQVRPLAEAVAVAAPDAAPGILTAAGWTPMRAAEREGGVFDLVAVRPGATLRIRRPGATPDLDGWAGGRELIFSRLEIVGGRPVPRDAALCTSGFLIRLPGGRLGGLSAAHCAGLSRNNTVRRRNSAMRRPPQPGIVLGRVLRSVQRTRPLDALVVAIPTGANRPASPYIDRGTTRPPLPVVGVAKPTGGREICFSGRTSGVDRCGRMAGAASRGAERFLSRRAGVIVRCTTVSARQGDSGGAVYTAPRGDNTVRALGLVDIIVGPLRKMCFTPISPVLDSLRASLVTAPRG